MAVKPYRFPVPNSSSSRHLLLNVEIEKKGGKAKEKASTQCHKLVKSSYLINLGKQAYLVS